MLQAHSLLWQYLWLAPNILGLGLAACLWRRGLHRQYPVFSWYLIFVAVEQFCLYALDLSPRVSPIVWWSAFWAGTIIEGLLKFAAVAELLQHLLHPWPSVAKLARNFVSGAGVILVLLAAVAAPFAAPDNTHWLVGGAHVLLQTLYIAQAGLIVSIFLVAAFFHIPWDRNTFGIALGFALVWCEHLAVWALVAGGLVRNRNWVDIVNMATYHVTVLIWYCYLLVPQKADARKKSPRDDHKDDHRNPPPDPPSSSSGTPQDQEEVLHDWNRELERLIHQ
jgi:hypothetical protein